MIDFEKTIEINMLLDFYGNLLTDKQIDYMKLYFNDDLSLQEIASINQVSRNAVYDNIQRTIKQLESYEDKLQLMSKFSKRQEIFNEMKKRFSDNPELLDFITKLEDIE